MKRLFCIYFLSLFYFIWGRLSEEVITTQESCTTTISIKKDCFYRPPEDCPLPNNTCRCQKLKSCPEAVVCCDVNEYLLTEGLACANVTNKGGAEVLHVRNATLNFLNVSNSVFRRFKSLSFTDGRVDSVKGEFGRHVPVSCLNLSSNNITKFEDRSLVNLYNLSMLDLSNNNLSDIPRFKKEGTVILDISANEAMHCSSVVNAVERGEIDFKNKNDTYCLSSKTFNWFNSTEKIPLSQVENLQNLKDNCIKNCSCQLYRMEIVPGKTPTLTVLVNCSGQKLNELPPSLPPNTRALNVSNNNIKSLETIANDPSYQDLRELFADNNMIDDILPLEGTKFLSNFMVLNLRRNNIKSLPTYVLENIFDRNYNSRYVHIGLNKIECDCNTAKVLRVWLLTKQKHIPDYDELYCDNMPGKVIELDASKLCQSQQDWTDYICYIITAEVLLLILLISKVSYDYWVFKTAGYLPWPASKMPKLPCDWLCE